MDLTGEESGTKILIIDDEAGIREMLSIGLRAEGFSVLAVADGTQGLQQVNTFDPDVVILDVLLPGLDGWDLLPLVRKSRPDRMVLMLTARDGVDDRVRGLTQGADDYLVKPFAFRELVARVRAGLRRRKPEAEEVLAFGALRLEQGRHRVTVDGREVHFSRREYELLRYLLLNPHRVLSKDLLLERVWGYDFLGDGNVVEVYIRYLRQKLGDQGRGLIRTVRGFGYQLGE